MSFKIGFTAETENENKRTIENTPVQKETPIVKKSVVEVFFPDRHLTCSYYNDMFNLKRGDIVYVISVLLALLIPTLSVSFIWRTRTLLPLMRVL